MPLLSVLISVHVIAAAIWVGGMFYAWMAMRPAVVQTLDPALRPALWHQTLKRFFRWVWLAIALLLISGYTMVLRYFGGMASAGMHIHIMQGIGIVMMLIFFHVFFAPFRRLANAVSNNDQQAGAAAISQIRKLVGINLLLGLILIAVASGGRYLHAG